MPIYEFFCDDCNTVFNFFSQRVNTETRPDCPKCGKENLQKMMSTFATTGNAKEEDGDALAGVDESKMEQAFEHLLRGAEGMDSEDPRQMATLMRKFSDKTGLSLGDQMEEALSRLESGEDPASIEAEMGEVFYGDDAFGLEAMKKKGSFVQNRPVYDEKLYTL